MIRAERIIQHHNAVPRAPRPYPEFHCDTVKVAAPGLEAEPTVTTKGCEPKGAFGGTVKLI
jgi:hypothetical protein